jgi:hypothetical protein
LEFRVQGPGIRAFDSGFGCWGLDVNLWFKDVEFRATQGKTADFRPQLLQPSVLVVPLPSEKGPTCRVGGLYPEHERAWTRFWTWHCGLAK